MIPPDANSPMLPRGRGGTTGPRAPTSARAIHRDAIGSAERRRRASERSDMIPDRLRAALREEGSAAFVTQGPAGPHLVATWNSYIEVVDDGTIVFPAGGYRR